VSALPLVIVALGTVPDAAVVTALGASRVLMLGTDDVVAETAIAAAVHVAWLPPWAALGPDVAAEVAAWCARAADASAPVVACAVPRLRLDDATSVRLPPRIVLSSPGAVDALGDAPRARRGARREDLVAPWDVALPVDLRSHLDAVNQQSSVAARLRHEAGQTTAWRDLTMVPAGYVVRALAGVTGSRRAALPHLVVEAYREVLVAAKLWELANGAAVA